MPGTTPSNTSYLSRNFGKCKRLEAWKGRISRHISGHAPPKKCAWGGRLRNSLSHKRLAPRRCHSADSAGGRVGLFDVVARVHLFPWFCQTGRNSHSRVAQGVGWAELSALPRVQGLCSSPLSGNYIGVAAMGHLKRVAVMISLDWPVKHHYQVLAGIQRYAREGGNWEYSRAPDRFKNCRRLAEEEPDCRPAGMGGSPWKVRLVTILCRITPAARASDARLRPSAAAIRRPTSRGSGLCCLR